MIRAYMDNVIIVLEKLPEMDRGLHLPENRKEGTTGTRWAHVVASGPGYYSRLGKLIPNEVKHGDRVLVGVLAGNEETGREPCPA